MTWTVANKIFISTTYLWRGWDGSCSWQHETASWPTRVNFLTWQSFFPSCLGPLVMTDL